VVFNRPIDRFLAENDLTFIDFHTDPLTTRSYRNMFLNDAAMTNLGNWHRFKTEYPASFAGMYQFWAQKIR